MSWSNFVKRHVIHNLGLKITSLILASALWVAVASSPAAEVALRVPLIFRSMPAAIEIACESIPEVQIRVRGPERAVRGLQAQDLRAELDLSSVAPGERTFDLTRAVAVPNGLEVAQVSPSEVHLTFDRRATREVPVKPRVTGTFASGYQISQIKSDPAIVEIVGPKKRVEAVDSAVTDPIDMTGALGSINVTRLAYVSDPLIRVAHSRPVQITVTMQKAPPTP